MVEAYQQLIGGEFVDRASGKTLDILIPPATKSSRPSLPATPSTFIKNVMVNSEVRSRLGQDGPCRDPSGADG